MSRKRMMLVALSIMLFGALLVPELALADVNDAGKNLGDLLQDWGTEIYVGVVAIVAIFFLVQRKYSELAIFGLAALFVGWLVLNPDGTANAGRDLIDGILGD